LGLGTAGALSPGGAAQALSAATAGIAGTRAAYEKEVLAQQTLPALDTAMHAQRDTIAAAIERNLTKTSTEYPLAAALSDLSAYYAAGTVLGALNGVTRVVGTEAAAAQNELRTALPVVRTDAARYLQQLVAASNPNRPANLGRIRKAMTAAGIPDTLTVGTFVLVGDPADPTALERVARALGWSP